MSRIKKHSRSRSYNGFNDDDTLDAGGWTESESSIVGAAKGVGKGVFDIAAGASKKIPSSLLFTNSRTKNKLLRGSSDPISMKYLLPESLEYPKYEDCISSVFTSDIPSLRTIIPTLNCITGITIGSGDGFFECFDSINERKKFIRNLIKKIQQNPDNIKDYKDFVKYDLKLDDIREKNTCLKEIERKLKSHSQINTSKRKERLSKTDPRISGKSMDTYAFDAIKNEKAGQPNADSYYAEGFTKLIIFGVADGIGWGISSRFASQAALLGFSTIVKTELSKISQKPEWFTTMLADICLDALKDSNSFVNGFTEAKTTMACGVVIELADQARRSSSIINQPLRDGEYNDDTQQLTLSTKRKWAFIGVSVGDTLIYRFSARLNKVNELTISDRTCGVRDAGGSLGGNVADLRNLGIHFCLVEEGDFILAVSDGVHDNLDPEVLKYSPNDCGLQYDTWDDVPNTLKNDTKRTFKENQLAKIILKYPNELTSNNVVYNVIEFVWESTLKHRNAYEEGSVLQRDWDKLDANVREEKNKQVQAALKNPAGKFDHVTCLAIKIERLQLT